MMPAPEQHAAGTMTGVEVEEGKRREDGAVYWSGGYY
jgi:hypothetical protein